MITLLLSSVGMALAFAGQVYLYRRLHKDYGQLMTRYCECLRKIDYLNSQVVFLEHQRNRANRISQLERGTEQ